MVVAVAPIALSLCLDTFPTFPDASPGVLASSKLAFHSSSLPSVVASAFERQPPNMS